MSRTSIWPIAFLFATTAIPAQASVVAYTSSAAFLATIAGLTSHVENFSSGAAGQPIANGSLFDGATYTAVSGNVVVGNTLLGSVITNQFNSFTGLSLGGNQSSGVQYFYGGDSVVVAFAAPVTSFGVFLNVNLDSGDYVLSAAGGAATTGSATYDTSTFVFDGLISTTPFTSVTFGSSSIAFGSFNVPEFITTAAAVPEPAGLSLLAAGVLAAGARRRRRTNPGIRTGG